MSVTRYEPWDVLSQLHNQINRVFDNQLDRNSTSSSATADWAPPADIEEYADKFLLKLDVPGVNVNAVEITLDQGVLSIAGEREKDAKASGVERSRLERPYGRFHRRFTLPDTVDAAAVRATGHDGVLEVTIPKQPKAQPRRIQVNTN
ncbi:MAG TPA: Hsp20/alpha crystallin family protein [Steroidobacteraceae bacterium]|nr:Hsp20/alpha crystallin family protein [Steroidobacteraceae bacterium]